MAQPLAPSTWHSLSPRPRPLLGAAVHVARHPSLLHVARAQFDQLVRYAADEYDCGAVDWITPASRYGMGIWVQGQNVVWVSDEHVAESPKLGGVIAAPQGQTDARGRFSAADAKAHLEAVSVHVASIPTIVVAARSDPVFRIEAAREMASAFGAQLVAVDGGHILSSARRDVWLGPLVEHWRANHP